MTIGGKKISLTTQIFVAMIIGSLAGLICGDIMKQVAFIGTIWLNCVKMIVVPMVFFTIITGITSQKNLSSLGRIAGHIIAYYVLTTLVAMLMYGKEASNRKQEIDRQHYTIPNQRPKDKHCGKI